MFNWIISGVLIGISNLIPGISGATTAVITNQYSRIMNELSLLLSIKLKQINYKYLITITLGALGGIVLFSTPLHFAMSQYQNYTLLMIVALIIGSIKSVRVSTNKRNWLAIYLNIYFGIGLIIIFGIIYLDALGLGAGQGVSTLRTFFSGFIAMLAMIIPGISGSMILVILGTYEFILGLIKEFDIVSLMPFFMGAIVATVVTTKLIKWLMKTYPDPLESLILGLLYGSIIYIILGINVNEMNLLVGITLSILGFFVSFKLVCNEKR